MLEKHPSFGGFEKNTQGFPSSDFSNVENAHVSPLGMTPTLPTPSKKKPRHRMTNSVPWAEWNGSPWRSWSERLLEKTAPPKTHSQKLGRLRLFLFFCFGGFGVFFWGEACSFFCSRGWCFSKMPFSNREVSKLSSYTPLRFPYVAHLRDGLDGKISMGWDRKNDIQPESTCSNQNSSSSAVVPFLWLPAVFGSLFPMC